MEHWADLCPAATSPTEGAVVEAEAEGLSVCLARIGGTLHALENLCPHRQGPLGQGWIEGNAVVCPWHAWAFDVKTGISRFPQFARVAVFPVREEDGMVQIELP